jgi:hypothetical protein
MSLWTTKNHGLTHQSSVCVVHRSVNKPCCDSERLVFGWRWRAPKKNNDAAWKRIEQGRYLWDTKAFYGRKYR